MVDGIGSDAAIAGICGYLALGNGGCPVAGEATSDEEAVRNAVRRCHIPANLSDSVQSER